jgi:DNA adenine methylase
VPEATLIRASALLKKATLIKGDFEQTISTCGSGDFIYLDPPYALSGRRVFSEYGPTPFQSSDLERLRKSLTTLEKRGAKFLVSYADCNEARLAFCDWTVRRVRTRRNIAGFTGDRRGSYELLATNLGD